MECLLCGHEKAYKHGKTTKGIQRYKCPHCGQTFPENLIILIGFGQIFDGKQPQQ